MAKKESDMFRDVNMKEMGAKTLSAHVKGSKAKSEALKKKKEKSGYGEMPDDKGKLHKVKVTRY